MTWTTDDIKAGELTPELRQAIEQWVIERLEVSPSFLEAALGAFQRAQSEREVLVEIATGTPVADHMIASAIAAAWWKLNLPPHELFTFMQQGSLDMPNLRMLFLLDGVKLVLDAMLAEVFGAAA